MLCLISQPTITKEEQRILVGAITTLDRFYEATAPIRTDDIE